MESGFTLVELLVVIAILAVLMSMLLVAMPAIREKGNRVKCAHNLKQLYLAFDQYVSDEHVYPQGGWQTGPNPLDKQSWGALITRYWMANTTDPVERLKKMQVVRCPTAVAKHGNSKDWSLMMNEWLQGKSFGGAGAGVVVLPTERVSKTILAGDGHWLDAATWGESKWGGIDPITNRPDFEHNRGSNFLFCDGHMAYLRPPKALEQYLWYTTYPLPEGQDQ